MKIRKILSFPAVYSTFRNLAGDDAVRQSYADQFIRASVGKRVLDIGCGTGDILKFLPAVDYRGFDISADYIASAKKKFGDRGHFFCQSIEDSIDIPPSSFDIVLAHGVLHHLNDAEAIKLFSTAYSALKPGGRLVTFDGCFVEDQSFLARFLVSLDRGRFVRDQSGYEVLAKTCPFEIKVSIRHNLIRLPYTHIIMECRK